MLYSNPYKNTGVVTEDTVEVLSGPGQQYEEVFALHSGAQVSAWWTRATAGCRSPFQVESSGAGHRHTYWRQCARATVGKTSLFPATDNMAQICS